MRPITAALALLGTTAGLAARAAKNEQRPAPESVKEPQTYADAVRRRAGARSDSVVVWNAEASRQGAFKQPPWVK